MCRRAAPVERCLCLVWVLSSDRDFVSPYLRFIRYDTSNLDDLFSHLTNTSINKFSPTLSDDKDGIGPGCKWRFGQLFALLQSRGVDFSRLWSRYAFSFP